MSYWVVSGTVESSREANRVFGKKRFDREPNTNGFVVIQQRHMIGSGQPIKGPLSKLIDITSGVLQHVEAVVYVPGMGAPIKKYSQISSLAISRVEQLRYELRVSEGKDPDALRGNFIEDSAGYRSIIKSNGVTFEYIPGRINKRKSSRFRLHGSVEDVVPVVEKLYHTQQGKFTTEHFDFVDAEQYHHRFIL